MSKIYNVRICQLYDYEQICELNKQREINFSHKKSRVYNYWFNHWLLDIVSGRVKANCFGSFDRDTLVTMMAVYYYKDGQCYFDHLRQNINYSLEDKVNFINFANFYQYMGEYNKTLGYYEHFSAQNLRYMNRKRKLEEMHNFKIPYHKTIVEVIEPNTEIKTEIIRNYLVPASLQYKWYVNKDVFP